MTENSNGGQLQKIDKRLFKVETNIKTYVKAAIWVIIAIFSIASFIGYDQYNIKKGIDELGEKAQYLKEEVNNIDKHINKAISKIKEEEKISITKISKATFERIKNIKQPYSNFRIFSAYTTKGKTNWEPYEDWGTVITVWIDTSKAGFTSTPIYLATLHGDGKHYEVVGIESIYDAAPDGFRLYLTFSDNSELTPSLANEYNWIVNWIGLEPLP